MRKQLSILLLLLVFFGCKKNEQEPTTPTPPTPTPPEEQPYGTPFANVPDTKEIVMYEVNMRAFSSQGNFKGVQARLDSIKALGVNVLWLMPIHPVGTLRSVGGLGSPYSVKNYKEVNPEFGTLDDFRNLVEQAHQRDMAVIIDWVANHTAWDNPWISNKSWYQQDNAGNIIIPPGTNWNDVAQLNFTNTPMRLEMISAMQHWVLQANIDGFRCDAADMVPNDFWKQALDVLRGMPNRKLILLAEGAKKDHYASGFQLTYGWDFNGKLQEVYKSSNPMPASALVTSHTSEYSGLSGNATRLRFTTNHDHTAWEDTPLTRFGGKAGSLSAFVITSYLGGVPLLYNGQEVGCPEKLPLFYRSNIDWTANPDMLAEYKRLMAFRNSSQAVKKGSLETFTHPDMAVFTRTLNQEKVLVMVNVRNSTITYPVASALVNTNWKNAFSQATTTLPTELTFAPYEYKILQNP